MTLALDRWVDDHLQIASRHGPEVRLRNCLFCGRSRTMKVNTDKLKFICFHEECQASGGLVRLVQAVEDVTLDDAVRIVANLIAGVTKAKPLEEVRDRFDAFQRGEKVDAPELVLTVPLPREFQACFAYGRSPEWKIPKFFTARGVPPRELKEWGIGFCGRGDYIGRVIVPVECDGMRSFVARTTTNQVPKYKTPGKVAQEHMLFGWDQVEEGARIIAVEGVFDAIRLWTHGHPAVAYFGDHLSPPQVELLERKRPTELILMPDGEDANARVKAISHALTLVSRFPSVRVAEIPGDPDELTAREVDAAVRDAIVPQEHDRAGVRLGSLRKSPLDS